MDLYFTQRQLLDSELARSVGWFRKQQLRAKLMYVVQHNRYFDIEEFLAGAELCFDALNATMYGEGSEGGRPDFGDMASERIATILGDVMEEYASDGIQMFTTSDEPTGYALHSAKIASLDVYTDDIAPESDGDETGQTKSREWMCIGVEFNATETFTMIKDGTTVDGSDVPRERTLVYVLRGRLDAQTDFGWHVWDMDVIA